MQCGTKGAAADGSQRCQGDAMERVFWPGQTIDLCRDCAARARALAEHMGFGLTCEPLTMGDP